MLGCLFPLVACICPILSPFVYLVLSSCSRSPLYPNLPSLSHSPCSFRSLYLVTCFLPRLSSFICLLLFSANTLVRLSPFTLSLPLYLAFSLPRISSLSRTNLCDLLQSLLLSLYFFSPCFSICLLLIPTRNLIYSCCFLSLWTHSLS